MRLIISFCLVATINSCLAQFSDFSISTSRQVGKHHYLVDDCSDSLELVISWRTKKNTKSKLKYVLIDEKIAHQTSLSSESIKISFLNPRKRHLGMEIRYVEDNVDKSVIYSLHLVDDYIRLTTIEHDEVIRMRKNCYSDNHIVFENTGSVTDLSVYDEDSLIMKKQFFLPEVIILKSSDFSTGKHIVSIGDHNLSRRFTISVE